MLCVNVQCVCLESVFVPCHVARATCSFLVFLHDPEMIRCGISRCVAVC